MRPHQSLPPDYFERLFAAERDPWGFETSQYERAKYDATLGALEDRRYRDAFEIGCANGVLTARLARVCTDLLAVDVSASALARAKDRCADAPGVAFAAMNFPAQRPEKTFDLIVMSEVAYYWSDADLAQAADYVRDHLVDGGDLLLVHWIGETDYPQTGDGAVSFLRARLPTFQVVYAERHAKYRLDLWRSA
jgi:predicted TPR repeat methyltransferase